MTRYSSNAWRADRSNALFAKKIDTQNKKITSPGNTTANT